MSISNFFILAIQMEDTDQPDKHNLRVLLYVNGVLDGVMDFMVPKSLYRLVLEHIDSICT